MLRVPYTLTPGIPSLLASVDNLTLKCPLLKCFHQVEKISAGRDPTAVLASLSHRDAAQRSSNCIILPLTYGHPSALFPSWPVFMGTVHLC